MERTNLRERLYVMCAACLHVEFIHADHGQRGCLYSECGCAAYISPQEMSPTAA